MSEERSDANVAEVRHKFRMARDCLSYMESLCSDDISPDQREWLSRHVDAVLLAIHGRPVPSASGIKKSLSRLHCVQLGELMVYALKQYKTAEHAHAHVEFMFKFTHQLRDIDSALLLRLVKAFKNEGYTGEDSKWDLFQRFAKHAGILIPEETPASTIRDWWNDREK